MNMLFILTQLILIVNSSIFRAVESSCSKGCDLALASYYVWENNLTFISQLTNKPIQDILAYNPQIPNQDSLQQDTRLNIPFSCDCLRGGEYLGHDFTYTAILQDTYDKVAQVYYSNLTTTEWVQVQNVYPATNIPDTGVTLTVTVNCSCGNADIDKRYGMFVTYPLRDGETLNSIAIANYLSADVITAYNPGANFSAGSGLIFFPGRDKMNYLPLITSTGLKGGIIAGISIAVILGLLVFAGCLYFLYYRKKAKKISLPERSEDASNRPLHDARENMVMETILQPVEFRYEELAMATNDFNIANKIGQGGFGAVYYAELRGEKAAIKKMDMQATREFLTEMKVLTNVHHVNLVCLIGYCTEGFLFLVYEFIENGNLCEHLRGSGKNPLPWPIRVQIALDSARGLEYIQEQTVPVYVHRDIKSANILIDKNFRGKVADFGLTKLTIVGGNNSEATRLVGTFGYMPPEYARYGEVSPKVDVYAFGVVLYELISAKEAVVKPNGSITEYKGLVGLFEEALSQSNPRENLRRLVDPALGHNCSLDLVFKMAQLAKACTNENPQLRPSMRSIVVALMTLSSTTEDWDVALFCGNQGLVDLISAR